MKHSSFLTLAAFAGSLTAQDWAVTTTYDTNNSVPAHWVYGAAGPVLNQASAGNSSTTPDGADRMTLPFTTGGNLMAYALSNGTVTLYKIMGAGATWTPVAGAAVNCNCMAITMSADGRTVWGLDYAGQANLWNGAYSSKKVIRIDFAPVFNNSGPPTTQSVDLTQLVPGVDHCRYSIEAAPDGSRVYANCITAPGPGAKWRLVTLNGASLAQAVPPLDLPVVGTFYYNSYNFSPLRHSPAGAYLLMLRRDSGNGPGHVVKVNLGSASNTIGAVLALTFPPSDLAIQPDNGKLAYVSRHQSMEVQMISTPGPMSNMTLLPVTPAGTGLGACAATGLTMNYRIDAAPGGRVYSFAVKPSPARYAVAVYDPAATVKLTCHYGGGTGILGGPRGIMVARTVAPPPGVSCPGGASGTICTVAGANALGFTPDGAQAVGSPISALRLGYDAKYKALLFADNNRIRGVNLNNGTLYTLAGTGASGYAEGAALTQAQMGNVVSGIAAHPTLPITYFLNGNNLALLRAVAISNNVVTTYRLAGDPSNFLLSVDGPPLTTAKMAEPLDVHYHAPSNSVYFLEVHKRKLRKLDLNAGVVTTVCVFPGTSHIGAMAFGNANDIFLNDGHAGGIVRTNSSCAPPVFVATANEYRLAFDPGTNRLFFPDGYRVKAVSGVSSPATTFPAPVVYAGNGTAGSAGDGAAAVAAQINAVKGLVLDPAGNLFISHGDRIRVVMK